MDHVEFITSIRDQCNAHLGGGSGPAPGPAPKPDAQTITSKPPVVGDHGAGNGPAVETQAGVNSPFGMSFTIRAEARNERKLRIEGHPGQFWDHNSWGIFDSAGNKALGQDNQVVVGTLGYTLGNEVLMQLGAGTYTVGFNLNASGPVATFFIQN